jgi:hypothetical protein
MPREEVPRFTSTFLCNLLAPPPRWKEVMRPDEFLPAVFDELRVRRFSAPTLARSFTREIADWRAILLKGRAVRLSCNIQKPKTNYMYVTISPIGMMAIIQQNI